MTSIDYVLQEKLNKYQRAYLEHVQPSSFSLKDTLDGLEFVRLAGVTRPSDTHREDSFQQRIGDFIIGVHSYGNCLAFVVIGSPENIGLWFALQNEVNIKELLSGYFPGSNFDERSVDDMGTRLMSRCHNFGVVSGIPSILKSPNALGKNEPNVSHRNLERIVRSMQNTTWFMAIVAYPEDVSAVQEDKEILLKEIAEVAPAVKAQYQRSGQVSTPVSNRETEVEANSMSGELLNRKAQLVVEQMEFQLKRLESMQSIGRWQVNVIFGSNSPADCGRLGSMFKGAFAGPESRPEPLRVLSLEKSSGKIVDQSEFHTFLSSTEMAAYMVPLEEEVPGFSIRDRAAFDVDTSIKKKHGLKLGQVEWEDRPIPLVVEMQVTDLARHGVIFGVTGSGKTTSLLNILNQVWGQTPAVPFLVIEPAKTEYRALLGKIVNGNGQGPIPTLQVYTLGNDNIAPFRINPFEFETGETPENSPLLPHIDFLKAVFNAAFILYAPMPYILEMALHEVFEDKGWSLVTGKNVRIPDEEWKNRNKYPVFPTLTDLYHKVRVVTRRLGYEARVEQDVIAGLQARIGALRLGSKGLMLDTPRGIPLAKLLAVPTVIELESIGNDDEKTFLMGLLLARIYEYRRIQNASQPGTEKLEHILVIEEAHRLLKNVNTQVDTESSNLRAQAIETFVNMLSEVRHYGQGVLIAEQIPSKLTPDVIKNTNLKIIHRLLSKDDRELVGFSMNMDETQVRRLATLKRGEAAIYTEDEDHPLLVKMENFKFSHRLSPPTDTSLRSASLGYISLKDYLFTPDYADYGLKIFDFAQPDPMVYQYAHHFLAQDASRRLWGMLLARIIYSRDTLPGILGILRRNIVSDPGQLTISQQSEALYMLLVLGAYQVLEARAAGRGWLAPAVASMRMYLTRGLVAVAHQPDSKEGTAALDRFVRMYEKAMHKSQGPYPGCHICHSPCAYLLDVQNTLSGLEIGDIGQVLDGAYAVEDAMYDDLRKILRATVQVWLDNNTGEVDDIGYCLGLHTARLIGLSDYGQDKLSRFLSLRMIR